jgi:pimeloyl-ACP methyl ester carboxylesterase
LLLLHGYSDSIGTWRPLLRVLAERERRALAVDLPGYDDGPLLDRIDRFVAQLVRDAAVPPVVIGNSLGGVAGLRAAQDPDLPLAAVVAISPGGLGHQPWVDLFERDPVIHRVVNARIPMPGPLIRWAVRSAYPRLALHDARRADRSVLAEYAARYSSGADIARVVREAREVLRELRGAYDLSRVCRPVQLIWGERDRLTPLKGAQRLLDEVADAELAVIERCGHCAQVEQPQRVADLVLRFADRVGLRMQAR